MTRTGLESYKQGLKNKVINHNLPKNPNTPADLKKALAKNMAAEKNFKAFAPSYRRYYIHCIELAKLPETRKRRIAQSMEMLLAGISPKKPKK